MKLIPKYQIGTPNGGVRDNTRVVNQHLQVLPLAQFPKLLLTQFYGDPRQPQLKSETRTPRELEINNQEGRKKAETLLWLKQREKNAEAFDNLMRLTMPSTYVGLMMGLELTGLPALAVDLAAGSLAGAARTVGRKGVLLATRLTNKAVESFRKRFVYPKLITSLESTQITNPRTTYLAETVNPTGTANSRRRIYVSPNSERVELQLRDPIMDLHSSRVLIKGNKLRNGHLFEDILESDIPLLKEMFNSGKYTEMIVPGSGQKVKMFILNNKLPVRYDVLEKLLQENDPALKVFETEYNNPLLTEAGKTELNKAKTKYKKIGDTYLSGLEELKEQTKRDYRSEINWDWYHGGILSLSNIPAKVATSPVYDPRFGRVVDLRPMMLRFYENVLDKDGMIQKVQKYLVDHKIIEPWEGKWLHQPKGSNSKVVVDPTRFTLNWILENELKSTNRINFAREFDRLGLTFIPYHSTSIGDLNIYRLFSNPNSRPLFASIDDGSLGFYPLKRAYQKTKFGTSIPVMRKAKPIEIETLISENGLHSSNNFGDVGELMKHFLSNGGRARQVRDVSDARNIKGNTGQRQNEYNFGTGTSDIGFLLNTFDLEYPSSIVGPFLGFKKGGKLLNHYKKINV